MKTKSKPARMSKKIKEEWKEIDWDGNPALKLKCWRKKFGRGHVSVGIGSFLSIVYSYGANSDDSLCSTRWRKDSIITCEEAMRSIDANRGKYRSPHLGSFFLKDTNNSAFHE